MRFSELKAREQVQKDPGASIAHTQELIERVCKEQRIASAKAIQAFIDGIQNLVSPQVVKAFTRAVSIANAEKLEEKIID